MYNIYDSYALCDIAKFFCLKRAIYMNFQHLRYIVEVDNTGSITKAAQNLYMGQPNLSKAIKEIEEEMGITIFNRTAKGVEPTRTGREFITYARKLLSQMDEFETIFKAPDSSHIQFNVTIPRATYCSVAFTEYMNELSETDKIKVYFREADAVTAINDTAAGDSDISVIRYQNIYEDYFKSLILEKELEYKPLFEFNMKIMMSENNPLACYDDVPYPFLRDYIEIIHGDYNVRGVSVSRINRGAEIAPPAKTIYIYDRGSQLDILQNVENSFMWVSPVPEKFLKRHGLVVKECSIAREIAKDVLIYKKGKVFQPHETLFVNKLKEQIEEL